MSQIVDEVSARIGARIRLERGARGWSLSELADRSAVSRAMINKIERGESSPTATVLGRLAGAFRLTIATLVGRAEAPPGRLRRIADQPLWTDPETGYTRRQVYSAAESEVDLTHVELPAGAEVAYPAATFAGHRRVIWVLHGTLSFIEGETEHRLDPGDSLELGGPADCVYRNDTAGAVRYLVVVHPGSCARR